MREAERVAAREAKQRTLSDPVERERHNERGRIWRASNPERAKAFKHEQRAMKAARTANRIARLKKATPPWVDFEAIRTFYVEAERMSRETGIQHNVDHIAPLAGRTSCGMHVPWNLRVITADLNRAKSNRLIEELVFATL